MKKIFFFAALVFSASMMAQESINWFSAIESNATKDGTAAVGNNSLSSISAYENGSVVVAGTFASCQETPATATFMGEEFVGAPFTVDQNNSNKNVLVSKINKDGEVQWLLHSNRGNGDAVAIATADGGALVFATVGHTDSDVQGDHKNLQLLNGEKELVAATHDFVNKNFQFGELIKVATDGESASIVGELLNQGTSNDFTALNWATDGTNYYLLVIVKKEVKFDETTLTPFDGGSLAVLKFDQDGKLLGNVLTDEMALTSTTSAIDCSADKVCVGTIATIDGLQSILLKTYNAADLTLAREDTIEGAVVNTKNLVQLKSLLVTEDAIFAAGAVNGGIKIGEDTLKNANNKLHGFVAKLDLASGETVKAYEHSTVAANIGAITDLFEQNGALYAFGYEMQVKDGNGIYLVELDKNLAAQDTIGLFKTSGTETTWDAVNADGNVVLAANTAKNLDLKFAADESKSVKTSTMSRILASVTLKAPKPTAVDSIQNSDVRSQKVVRNGQLLIIRDGKTFNALGAQVQ